MRKFLKRKYNSLKKEKGLPVYWSSHKHIKGENWDNFGDALVPFLVEKISGKKVSWHPLRSSKTNKVYIVIGSILELVGTDNIVWGAGIIKSNAQIANANILAVRGPISYSRVLASGIKMKKIWGDPALLLPYYFSASKKAQSNKTLVIPHYVDFEEAKNLLSANENLELVDLKKGNLEEIISEIAGARLILSSSLHGLIVAHAYGVPAIWVKFTDDLDGDDIKFNDYFLSVGIRLYKPFKFHERLLEEVLEKDILLPDLKLLNKVQLKLIESCPFLNK
ncbi:polysaccharide pyruvyl transferase family protein [Salinimicrobium gaetbulicola]|uniref:Polysaccharide pyruvyl transferase family protein n=1 Tax=Salinimicrobium gaetbulicola TaxID=999702 RepID=A0ABW3IK88_9FLAO